MSVFTLYTVFYATQAFLRLSSSPALMQQSSLATTVSFLLFKCGKISTVSRVQMALVSSKVRSVFWMLQAAFRLSESDFQPSRQHTSASAFDAYPLTVAVHWPSAYTSDVAHAAGSTPLAQQVAASITVVEYCGDSVPSKNTVLVSE